MMLSEAALCVCVCVMHPCSLVRERQDYEDMGNTLTLSSVGFDSGCGLGLINVNSLFCFLPLQEFKYTSKS